MRRHASSLTLTAILSLVGPSSLQAQSMAVDFAGHWSWDDVRRIPDVDTARVRWLERTLPTAEAKSLFATIASLSKPEAAQVLPTYFYLDGSASGRTARSDMDSLVTRGPGGDAGAVRLAYLVASMRHRTLDRFRTTTYRATFDSAPVAIPAAVRAAGRTQPPGFALSFDFGPVDTLLAIVTTRDITPAQVLPRISIHPFDALIRHHSQSFYPQPLSRELLALNLSHAASNQPLDRLYAYAAPAGLLHYVDLRTNAPRYRALLDTLRRHEDEILGYAAQTIAQYVPPGTQLNRRVSFFVVDWSDGWGAMDVTAVDLEYYKGDLDRLINTLVHESFHATQQAVRAAHPASGTTPRTAADSALRAAAEYLLVEGTANFVAPAVRRTPESAAAMADSGAVLLDRLVALTQAPGSFDRTAAQEILDRGVAGGGPFYWLGAAMTRTLVERDGPRAVGAALEAGSMGLLRSYARASRDASAQQKLLTPRTLEWLAKS